MSAPTLPIFPEEEAKSVAQEILVILSGTNPAAIDALPGVGMTRHGSSATEDLVHGVRGHHQYAGHSITRRRIY